jgi:glutamine synthetase
MKVKALKLMKDEEVEYVDIRFTDPKGKLQHVTLVADLVDEDFFEEGFMFDGSSIAGWKSIDQSDMKLMPDAASVYIDPFYAEKTLCVHCNVVEPDTGEAYSAAARARPPEGRGLPEILGHRRHRLFRAGSRILPVRRRALFGDPAARFPIEIDAEDAAWNTDTVPKAATWPPRAPQGRLFPGEPD